MASVFIEEMRTKLLYILRKPADRFWSCSDLLACAHPSKPTVLELACRVSHVNMKFVRGLILRVVVTRSDASPYVLRRYCVLGARLLLSPHAPTLRGTEGKENPVPFIISGPPTS